MEFFMMCSYRRQRWHGTMPPSSRIMVSLLLPGPMEADQWLHKVRANRHMWPLQMTSHSAANQLTTEIFAESAEDCRRVISGSRSNPTAYTVLHRRLFLHEFTEESRWLENSYKGPNEHRVKWQWKRCQAWFATQATAQFPSQWVSTLYLQRLDQLDVLSWQWIDY